MTSAPTFPVQLCLAHSDAYRRGRVPLHFVFQPRMPKVETFVMPHSFSYCFAFDTWIPEPKYPSIYDALFYAHTEKYRKGRVDKEMVVNMNYPLYVLPPLEAPQKMFELHENLIRAQERENRRAFEMGIPAAA